jgi:putative DNA primase/helicase
MTHKSPEHLVADKIKFRTIGPHGEASTTKDNGGNGKDQHTTERAPHFSDEALAITFAQRHADSLRYVAKFGRWMSWTGQYWRSDDTLHAFNLSRAICREAAATCNKPGAARALASAKTVAAVERRAKADRRLAATAEQWDADPWKFNAGE